MILKELKLELTQQCPLACVHCSTDSHRLRSSSLDEETVLRLLREGAALGVEKVAFSGGEPLLVPYLPTVVRQAQTLGIHSSVYTCGAVDDDLTPLSAESALLLAESGIGRLIFSLYSHRAEVHNSVTRYGSFNSTVRALQNGLSSGIPVEIHFVAMQRNFRYLPGLVAFAAQHGVQRLSVLRFVPHGRGIGIASREDLSPDDMRELRQMILAARAEYPEVNVRAGSPMNILGIGHTPCDAAQDVLVINHRGEIFPCDAFKNVSFQDPQFGSVFKQPLKDVWEQSAFLNRVRTELSAGPQPTCGSCEEFSGCRSGCLAQKVIRDGWQGAVERDPACLVQIELGPVVDAHQRSKEEVILRVH